MYIVDADDFCESNTEMDVLLKIKEVVPEFKITLFTIVGLCSGRFFAEMSQLDWIDLVPHGLYHPHPRECENWAYIRCCRYLDLVDIVGITKGFKAPGWQISDGMYEALLERGYWVADQEYNNSRRPPALKAYLLDSPNKLHFHIGRWNDHNLDNQISLHVERLRTLRGEEFGFVKHALC
jgi:hypothetical protein